MLEVRPIVSLDLPELKPYRTLRRPAEHERQAIFVAEGEKLVRRLLETELVILSLLTTTAWLEKISVQLENRPETIQAFVAEKELLHTMVGFELYQGLLAVARVRPPPTLTALLDRAARPRLLVALDGLANAENLGVLVRNCAGFRVQGLIVGPNCGSPWLRRAVRNSMGAIFHLPVHRTEDLPGQLADFNRQGMMTVAAHPHSNGRKLSELDLRGDCCLVFGSEGHGLSPAVLAACAQAAALPMPSHMDSLNVSSAAAAFLYEVNRQRGRA